MDVVGALIPRVSGLTAEQALACERFAIKVFGARMFFDEPSHNGRHGYACEQCLPVLAARDLEQERVHAITQPWELREAA